MSNKLSMVYRIDGLQKFSALIKSLPAKVAKKAFRKATSKAGTQLKRDIVARAPVGQRKNKRLGKQGQQIGPLRRVIRKAVFRAARGPLSAGSTVDVGYTGPGGRGAFYGLFLEHGTKLRFTKSGLFRGRVNRHNIFRSPLETKRDLYATQIIKEIEEALYEIAAKGK